MSQPLTPDGILLVDKPAGVTSHDVVLAARRATREKRIGHAGTLDPFATGLLVLMIGRATRLLPYLNGDPKVYEARIVFGTETDTDDPGGTVTCSASQPEWATLEPAAHALTGEILQVPSSYSAKRVEGRRAYAVARSGKDPELKPVPVRIDSWESIGANVGTEGVESWDVRIICSGGTYVRALARDLGRAVGSAAHLGELRRVRSGGFHVDDAVTLRDLLEGKVSLAPPVAALSHLPYVELDSAQILAIVRGIDIEATVPGERAALVSRESGVLVAVAERRGDRWQPRVVMRKPESASAVAATE